MKVSCCYTCVAAGPALTAGAPLAAGCTAAVAVPDATGRPPPAPSPAAAAAAVPDAAASSGCGVLAAACLAALTSRSRVLRRSSSPAQGFAVQGRVLQGRAQQGLVGQGFAQVVLACTGLCGAGRGRVLQAGQGFAGHSRAGLSTFLRRLSSPAQGSAGWSRAGQGFAAQGFAEQGRVEQGMDRTDTGDQMLVFAAHCMVVCHCGYVTVTISCSGPSNQHHNSGTRASGLCNMCLSTIRCSSMWMTAAIR
jgi:hypothetical protein